MNLQELNKLIAETDVLSANYSNLLITSRQSLPKALAVIEKCKAALVVYIGAKPQCECECVDCEMSVARTGAKEAIAAITAFEQDVTGGGE